MHARVEQTRIQMFRQRVAIGDRLKRKKWFWTKTLCEFWIKVALFRKHLQYGFSVLYCTNIVENMFLVVVFDSRSIAGLRNTCCYYSNICRNIWRELLRWVPLTNDTTQLTERANWCQCVSVRRNDTWVWCDFWTITHQGVSQCSAPSCRLFAWISFRNRIKLEYL
jgi:hypothetical protein